MRRACEIRECSARRSLMRRRRNCYRSKASPWACHACPNCRGSRGALDVRGTVLCSNLRRVDFEQLISHTRHSLNVLGVWLPRLFAPSRCPQRRFPLQLVLCADERLCLKEIARCGNSHTGHGRRHPEGPATTRQQMAPTTQRKSKYRHRCPLPPRGGGGEDPETGQGGRRCGRRFPRRLAPRARSPSTESRT